MVQRKLLNYAPYLDELKDDGVEYRPFVWSCWGRPHIDASSAVRSMSEAASRRHGAVKARDLERRASRAVFVQLWKRAARMVEACKPVLDCDEAALLLPRAVVQARAPTPHHADGRIQARAPPLHADRAKQVVRTLGSVLVCAVRWVPGNCKL